MLAWLDKFKQVGDVAVNFDPQHAALPWAGIRLLLEVSREHTRPSDLFLPLKCSMMALSSVKGRSGDEGMGMGRWGWGDGNRPASTREMAHFYGSQ